MLTARPLESFRIARKMVVICQVGDENPSEFLGKEFFVFSEGRQVGRMKIDGASTASLFAKGLCDFSYSGDEIRTDQLGEGSLISEASYATAVGEVDDIQSVTRVSG